MRRRVTWKRSPADPYAVGVTLLVAGLGIAAYLLDVPLVWVVLFAVPVLVGALAALFRRAGRTRKELDNLSNGR